MRASNLPVRATLLLAASATLATVAILGTLWATGALACQETRQGKIAEKGAEVMPFDLEKTSHSFEKTETGGVQKVVATDRNDDKQDGRSLD